MLKRKKHFKITILLLLVALFIQMLPFQVAFHPGGIGIEKSNSKVYAIDKEIEYDGTGGITDSEADIAVDQMVYGLGVELKNKDYKILNGRIYIMYGIIAYGFPSFNDKKTPAEYPELKRTEYRYLGYAEDGTIITNDDFPDDATGDAELPDKNWIYSDPTKESWNKLDNLTQNEEDALIHYILFEGDLKDDGSPIDLKANEILGTSNTEELKKYITLQTYPTIKGRGSFKIIHITHSGREYYDTFTIDAFEDEIELKCRVETDKPEYIILPKENYVDVVIDVSAVEDLGKFPSTYITKRSVKYDGKTKDGNYGQYTERIYKSDLNEGYNEIDITGHAEFTSIFPSDGDTGNDGIIRKTDTELIKVIVVKDELYVRLGLPPTAGIDEPYLIEDLTHYPEGEQVKSSKLYKRVSNSWELIETWGKLSESMTDSHPVKATIDYKLVVELENGEIGEDIKSIKIIDDRSVDATADLELDIWTYEGHPAYARDVSVFDVEGETYRAARAYEENIATNRFKVVENTPHTLNRLSSTKAKIIFNEVGYYNVELRVRTQDGNNLYDIEPIEVRKTPYVNDFLGGVQKENRKQILNISVAKNPDYPITNFWVEIEDAETGEKVHLTSQKQNSANIKTRDIALSETECFTNYTLEFLTKNDTEKTYRYTIYVKDAKGDTDTVTKDFTVYPDEPPVAQIHMSNSFVRNEDSNIAEIIAEDMTISSDGDQVERTWQVAFDTNNNNDFSDETYINITELGYEDLSFGALKEVQFNKTGVGKFNVRLDVKEVWTEPTLEEYVTDADRLTDYTEKISEVTNIPPRVSLEPVNTDMEDIIILTPENQKESLKSNLNTLNNSMISNAIDSQITVSSFKEEADNTGEAWSKSMNCPDYYANTHYNNFGYNYQMDNTKFYRIRAGIGINSSNRHVEEPPFIIEAFDNETGNLAWSYTLDETYQNSRFQLKNDDLEKYLYVVPKNGGMDKMIIIDKATGAFIVEKEISYSKVEGSFYLKEHFLYIVGSSGIYQTDLNTGIYTKIFDKPTSCPQKVAGKVHFAFNDDTANYRGILDLSTGGIEQQLIKSYGIDEGYTAYEPVAIDMYGTFVLFKSNKFYIYDINNICINEVRDTLNGITYGVITDFNSKITHVYTYDYSSASNGRRHKFFVGNVVTGETCLVDKVKVGSKANESFGDILLNKSIGNTVYIIIDGNSEDGWMNTSVCYEIEVDNESIDTGQLVDSSSTCEFSILKDNYAAFISIKDSYTEPGIQSIKLNKLKSTLQGNIDRTVNKDASFREGYQRNVVIVDNQHPSNTEIMSTLIQSIKNLGAKFTGIGNMIAGNHYLVKIKDALLGNIVQYNTYNIENNLINLGNVINTKKEEPKNSVIGLTGTGHSNASLNKSVDLDPDSEYCYEYDIKYINKGSMTNADVFDINHDFTDVSYAGQKQVAVPTGEMEFENFENGSSGLNEFFQYNGHWRVGGHYKITGAYGAVRDKNPKNPPDTLTSTITFTTDKSAVLSFEYDYIMEYRTTSRNYDDSTDFSIKIDGQDIPKHTLLRHLNSQDIVAGNSSASSAHFEGSNLYYSKIIPPGEHEIELKYSYYYKNSHYAYIDNLSVRYVDFKTDGSYDSGQLVKNSSSIVEDNWMNIQGNFTVPNSVAKYAYTNKGENIYENFSDDNLNFQFDGNYRATSGQYRPIEQDAPSDHNHSGYGDSDNPEDDSRFTELTVTVPPGNIGYLAFAVKPVFTYVNRSYGDYGDILGRVYSQQLNFNHYITYQPYPSGYRSYWIYFGDRIGPGTYKIKFTSYAIWGRIKKDGSWPRFGWRNKGYLAIDNLNLRLEPSNYNVENNFTDDNARVYTVSKKYDKTSTLQMKYSSTKDSNFMIENFKLYKVVDGKKILQHKFDALSQEELERLFDIDTSANANISIINEPIDSEAEEEAPLIYKKGQLVLYNVYYDDFENDPSKKQYWQYTHTPWADGLHPDAGKILNEPIDRFYIDGKYTVKHWQEDSTGVDSYDKLSNVEEIIFYVEGTDMAPEVTYIKTIPGEVKEGDDYRIEIGVWDEDLDTLDTTIELFKNNRLIYTYKKDGVAPVNGEYTPVISGYAPTATPGKYTVVATASDGTATGVRSYTFTVVSEGKIEGMVNHTEQWDINRKKYNLSKTGTEESPRGYNVFWSGERFVLQGSAEGRPISVHVQILENPYSTYLSSFDGGSTWKGDLWEESMINRWGVDSPEPLTFRFTANFNGGIIRTDDVQIIVDDRDQYWQYHQKW